MPRRTTPVLTVENIVSDLQPLVVPIEWITPLVGNPRRGKVEALARSYARFGQRKPIVVNKTGEEDGHPVGMTEAGNHQTLAAESLGWKYIAVVWVEDDETTAKAFSLADNNLHDIGEYDTPLLAQYVADIATTGEEGVAMLADAGFTGDELTALIESTMQPLSPNPGDAAGGYDDDDSEALPGAGIGLGTPVISTTIVFDTEAQQTAWYALIRWLRTAFPEAETTGERLHELIRSTIPLEDADGTA